MDSTLPEDVLSALPGIISTPPPHGGERLTFEQPVSKYPPLSGLLRSVPTPPARGGKRLTFEQISLEYPPLKKTRVSQQLLELPIQSAGALTAPLLTVPLQTPFSLEPARVPAASSSTVPSQKLPIQPARAPAAPLSTVPLQTLPAQPVRAPAVSSSRVLLQSPSSAPSASLARIQTTLQALIPTKTPIQLTKAYEQRRIATTLFPPEISESCIRDCISRFEDHMTAAAANTENICGSCGRFIIQQVFSLSKDDPLLQPFYNGPDSSLRLDSCALIDNTYLFCRSCFNAIQKRCPPKYSVLNSINVSFCQDYPRVLQDLTLTEECLIARSRPIASILKLRPNGASNPVAYSRLRGHVIVLPQDPGPLLDILPSQEFKLHEKIMVVWLGNRAPTASDLKPYLEVRKHVVYKALQWLRLYNKLYSQITINQDLLDSWADSFIPSELEDSIVYSKNDHEEREGYVADIGLENCENDLQETLGDQECEPISSGCVYSDVESARQHPTVQLVSAILNLEKDRFQKEYSTNSSGERRVPPYVEDVSVIRYVSNGHSVLMNDWQDPEYFTGSFPTLFPFGLGGHLPGPRERTVPVSLKAWAKWALSHHNRRFARHPTFMYLVYDVLQRRQAALGSSIMVKRKDWEKARSAISSLTFDRLTAAAKSVLENNTHDDPTILLLERQIQTVASQVPQSFARVRNMRLHMRALFLCLGMPAFWMTLNPGDLRNPLVLKLAGIELSCDDLSAEARNIRQTTARMNPVAVAQFFHTICTGVFDALLGAGTDRSGIFGHVSNYFGVVETNGRGMLHLHCLIWLAGNLEFQSLRERLLRDPDFSAKMIRYLKSVIKCSINFAAEHLEELGVRLEPPSAKDPESDSAFLSRLHCDSNAVAFKWQMHSKNHSRACFKYGKSRPRECRFLFPRKLVAETHVDSHGVIQLERNNEWVTPWNPSLSSLLRSNHDINFIPTLAMALGAVYYMTNYATKYDVSRYQLILAAAILKHALEDAEAATNPSERQLRLRRQNMDKFALRAFNRLSCDREISGPQAASCLLDLPDYYTLPTKIRRLSLSQLRRRFEHIVTTEPRAFWEEEESTIFTCAKKAPQSVFDHYYWRGPLFLNFCLYEYFKLVTVKPIALRTTSDIRFAPAHPGYETHVQRYFEKSSADEYIVALTGSLSENQSLEDSVRGGHPETESMQNDLALVLLGLLVPWNRLQPLFSLFNCANKTYKEHCAEVWSCVKPSLSDHIQDVAQNIQLLRKSKADAQVNAALRKNVRCTTSSQVIEENLFDDDDNDDDNEEETSDDNVESSEATGDSFVDLDTLYQAFSIIKDRWAESDQRDTENIPSLFEMHRTDGAVGLDSTYNLDEDLALGTISEENDVREFPEWLAIHGQQSTSSYSMPENDQVLGIRSDFHNVDPRTLLQWQERLTASGSEDLSPDFDVDADGDQHQLLPQTTENSNCLFPIIDHEQLEINNTVTQLTSRVNPNPTGASLAQLIQEALPLNKKQLLAVSIILDHAIQHQGKAAVEAQDQMLLFVTGEGGTGKSQIIKAVKLGYELLQRGNEVLLMAYTGAAASKIEGRTIHNALCLGLSNEPRPNISSYVYSLWKRKSIMIIDEISMISQSMLNTINQQCCTIRSVQKDSTAVLGALPIVTFMGDLHQFPPVQGTPLWEEPNPDLPSDALGQQIWHRFKSVIILDEQMRQRNDLEFQSLLQRARTGTMTSADVFRLNRRVVQSLPLNDGLDSVCITRRNQRRHHINRLQIRRFAGARAQDIYVFPASHSRTKRKDKPKTIDKILETQDGEGSAKGPGLLLYTQGMPITVLYNISTPLGLVNGATGTAAGIVPDPNAQFFRFDQNFVLCSHPPRCVLLKRHEIKHQPFPDIDRDCIPIFAMSFQAKVGDMWITREQVPISPAFALTEYKVQGGTYRIAVLDLSDQSKSPRQKGSHKYFSVNVQLSRLKSEDGIQLLQPVTFRDLNIRVPHLLEEEDRRLSRLAAETTLRLDSLIADPENDF